MEYELMINKFNRYQIVSWLLYFLGIGLGLTGIFSISLLTFKIPHPYAMCTAGILLGMTSNAVDQAGKSHSTLKFWRIDNLYLWQSGVIVLLALMLIFRIITG